MGSWSRQVMAFSVIGVAATVGVAWALSVGAVGGWRAGPSRDNPQGWPVSVPADWTYPTMTAEYEYVGGNMTLAVHEAAPFRTCSVEVFSSGWPWRATKCWVCIDDRVGRRTESWQYGIGAKPEAVGQIRRVLGLRPVWPGFVVDVFFYGAGAWALWQLPTAIRRRMRLSRFQCVHCGYNVGALPIELSVCPECGQTYKA